MDAIDGVPAEPSEVEAGGRQRRIGRRRSVLGIGDVERRRGARIHAHALERDRQELAQVGLIVDDQYRGRGHGVIVARGLVNLPSGEDH